MVCFALSDAQTTDIPQALRVLFRQTECRTKARRMGKIIRITSEEFARRKQTEIVRESEEFQLYLCRFLDGRPRLLCIVMQ